MSRFREAKADRKPGLVLTVPLGAKVSVDGPCEIQLVQTGGTNCGSRQVRLKFYADRSVNIKRLGVPPGVIE